MKKETVTYDRIYMYLYFSMIKVKTDFNKMMHFAYYKGRATLMFNHHCIKDFWFHGGLVFGHMKSALILFKLSLLLGMW